MQRHPEIPKTASASRHERYWLLLFVALAAALRLTQLGERPFHHDESIHAWFAYQIFQGQAYRFDPMFHGPWLYWSNALVYVLLGASDFTARLLPALASTAMLLPLWMLRRELGVIGWKVTAAFVILSPTLVYYGRFLGHDSYCALFTLLWVALAFAWHRWPLPRHALAFGVVTGLFFATKAVAFIHIGLFAIFVGLVLALDTFAPRWPRAKLVDLAWRWLLQRRAQLGLALLSAGAVYMALYSSFFTHWPGIIDGVVGTLDYWSGQHVQPRI
ncbi:MAG: TIGR03663 family protein, partial [Chromatocurvus sp.]